jgi:hypothetical protein
MPGIQPPIQSADQLIDQHGVKLSDSIALQQQSPTPTTGFLHLDAGDECTVSQESLTSLRAAAGGGQGSPHTGTVSTIVLAEPRTDSEESNLSALNEAAAPRSGSSPTSCWETTAACGQPRNSCSDYVIDSMRRAGTSSGPGGLGPPRACSEPEQLLLLANSRDAGVTNQMRRSGREQTNGRPAFKSDTERRSASRTQIGDSLLSREVES